MATAASSKRLTLQRRSCLGLATAAALSALGGGASYASQATKARAPLRFGVFPYLPPLTLDRLFAPVLQSLAAAVHRPIYLRTKADFEAFEAALLAGDYDIAFVHPFFAVRAMDEAQARPLVRLATPFELAFLVNSASGIADVQGLNEKVVATPPQLSAAAILAESDLLERHIQFLHAPTPSKLSCLQKVLRGEVDACALPGFALRQLELAQDPRFAVIHRAQLPVSLSIVAMPQLDVVTSERLVAEICAWSAGPGASEVLAHAGWPGFVRARGPDYNPARAMLRIWHTRDQRT